MIRAMRVCFFGAACVTASANLPVPAAPHWPLNMSEMQMAISSNAHVKMTSGTGINEHQLMRSEGQANMGWKWVDDGWTWADGWKATVSAQPQPQLQRHPQLSQRKDSLSAETETACKSEHRMPTVLWRSFAAIAEKARASLVAGSSSSHSCEGDSLFHNGEGLDTYNNTLWRYKGFAQYWQPSSTVCTPFDAALISLPLAPPMIMHAPGTGSGQGDKNIVGKIGFTRGGSKCVVYGIGIADDPSFEEQIAETGCEVHAFDCTVHSSDKELKGAKFTFHNWCIGEPSQQNANRLQGNIYSNNYAKGNYRALSSSLLGTALMERRDVENDQHPLNKTAPYQFKKLSQTMQELGHEHVDLLKFDIEGYEWKLFQTEILTMETDRLPEQISFELHTQRANPYYVPHELVKGKGYAEVNSLFLMLHDKGYRIASKELNSGDPACCEFILVKMDS